MHSGHPFRFVLVLEHFDVVRRDLAHFVELLKHFLAVFAGRQEPEKKKKRRKEKGERRKTTTKDENKRVHAGLVSEVFFEGKRGEERKVLQTKNEASREEMQ